jgi:hypothetical protein
MDVTVDCTTSIILMKRGPVPKGPPIPGLLHGSRVLQGFQNKKGPKD